MRGVVIGKVDYTSALFGYHRARSYSSIPRIGRVIKASTLASLACVSYNILNLFVCDILLVKDIGVRVFETFTCRGYFISVSDMMYET